MKEIILIEMCLYSLGICLHTVAFFLIHRSHDDIIFTETQRLYLMNLNVVEIFLAISFVANKVVRDYFVYPKARFILHIVHGCLFSLWYIFVMVLITIDRFLTVYFCLRYPLIWSLKKTKVLMVFVSVLSVFMTFILNGVVADTSKWDVTKTYTIYRTPPVLDVLFLILICLTYGYLFHRIRVSQRSVQPQDNLSGFTSNHTTVHKLKRKFYFPTLLIISFILFWMLPNWIHYYYYTNDRKIPSTFHVIIDMCYSFAIVFDAFIYIFSLPNIRMQFLRFFYQ
jgi:7 transmembrane receptor (rhodopsin family).